MRKREKDLFYPHKDGEELLGFKVLYLSIIGTLMYLANYMCLDIAFFVNLVTRYSCAPTWKHWNDIKYILCYLGVRTNISLLYSRKSKVQLPGDVEIRYLSKLKLSYKHDMY